MKRAPVHLRSAGAVPATQGRRTFVAALATLGLGSIAVVAAPRERTLKVVAKKFVFVPALIKARVGETLVLKITAPEVPMGFSAPDFGVRADVVPGKDATVRLVMDKAGTFTFLCDVFCGQGHEDMNGTLVVT